MFVRLLMAGLLGFLSTIAGAVDSFNVELGAERGDSGGY